MMKELETLRRSEIANMQCDSIFKDQPELLRYVMGSSK